MNRQTILAVTAAVLFLGAAAWWWMADRGITLNFNKTPLSQVLPVVEKRTGIRILTNLDPATPVTLMVYQASPAVVWEALAGAVGTRASLRAVLAPDKATLEAHLAALASGARPEDWESYRVGVPGMMTAAELPEIPDPRRLPLAAPPSWPSGPLQTHLATLAEASEITWTAPKAWNPEVAFQPSKATAQSALDSLARAAGGEGRMVLALLSFRREGEGGPGGGGDRGPGGGGGGFWGGRGMPSPEVVERRTEQRIALLPAEQQAAAREALRAEREFWASLRELPPEQRQERLRERFEDPAVQERIENRMAERDARTPPERRRERYRDYLERRAARQ